jgi:hypothetical protein
MSILTAAHGAHAVQLSASRNQAAAGVGADRAQLLAPALCLLWLWRACLLLLLQVRQHDVPIPVIIRLARHLADLVDASAMQ